VKRSGTELENPIELKSELETRENPQIFWAPKTAVFERIEFG